MSQSIKERLESMFLKTKSSLNGADSILEDIEPMFDKLMSEFNSEAVTFCLEKYIKAELDYTTPGNRGIGRMTANIPRFGAYFRKSLSKLSVQELNKLGFLIEDICLRGYLDSAIYMKWPANSAKLSDKVLLFSEWIPSIYVMDPYRFSPELWDITRINVALTIIEIKDFMRKHGMIKDNLFKRADKVLSEILEYYAVAGYSLRAVEEGYY